MASNGIDPLVRLQTGSKELRAERELCQVAAEKGFSTESGAATSTVMGSRMDEQALVESVENEVASALYFADSLPADIENICLDPGVDADDLKHALCNIISSALNPWALHIIHGVKAQVLQQVQESIDKGSDAKKVMHKTLSDHIDNMGANWLKMRALVALFTFELGPPHNDGWASGGSSEEMSPKTCTTSAPEVI